MRNRHMRLATAPKPKHQAARTFGRHGLGGAAAAVARAELLRGSWRSVRINTAPPAMRNPIERPAEAHRAQARPHLPLGQAHGRAEVAIEVFDLQISHRSVDAQK